MIIVSAIHACKTGIMEKMKCGGQEAPDHLEKSSDGSLKYIITITYK